MLVRSLRFWLAMLVACILLPLNALRSQETARPARPSDEPPAVPKGIEVLARGPVHEAFASLTTEPAPTKPISKKPPKPLDELPPTEKPEGHVIWIGGYWAWDDERQDFLWVSGIWRTPPPHKQWIAGYWREEGEQWQWVAGFWTDTARDQDAKEITYLPKPPEPPGVAPPGQAPAADCFYVPGAWVWVPNRGSYAWRAGYWARVQPGYVWVPDHYRWTPAGYVYISGYWDLAVSRRGVLYAPVVVDPTVVTVGFYYTPAYAVSDTVVVDSLFVRPAYGHYYFGDYYGPAYTTLGYESVVVYSGRRYDSIIVYETWAHRNQPNWLNVQINIANGRNRGVLPVPPRTLVQQNTIIQQNITNVTNVTNNTNNTTNITNNITNNSSNMGRSTTNYNTQVLAPASKVAAASGIKTVPLDSATRLQARQQAAAVQQVAQQRTTTERPSPPGAPRQARVASLSVPKAQPVQPGFVAPRVTPQAVSNAQAARPLQPVTAARQGFSSATQPGVNHLTGASARPGMSNVPNKSGTFGTPSQAGPYRGGPPGRPGVVYPGQPPSGLRPGSAPPGVPPRPTNQLPAKKPPPKDNKDNREHH